MDTNDSLKNVFQKATEMKIEPKKTAWDRLELQMQKEKFKKQTHWATMSIAASFVVFISLALVYLVQFKNEENKSLAKEKTIEINDQKSAESIYGKVPESTQETAYEEQAIAQIAPKQIQAIEYPSATAQDLYDMNVIYADQNIVIHANDGKSETEPEPKEDALFPSYEAEKRYKDSLNNSSSLATLSNPRAKINEIISSDSKVILNSVTNFSGYVNESEVKIADKNNDYHKDNEGIKVEENTNSIAKKEHSTMETSTSNEEKPKGLILIRKKAKPTAELN